MKNHYFFIPLLVFILGMSSTFDSVSAAGMQKRILIVSSYHQEYLWSQDTNAGVVSALLELGYLENTTQGEAFTRDDFLQTSRLVLKKLWMDTKRKRSKSQIKQTVASVINEIDSFNPDLVLLGDDNAANYIGNHYVDTDLPLVFWGINGNPMKYGLLDSIEKPGHNITGVYQAGYLKEGLLTLLKLMPEIKSIAILTDDSPTGRSNAKELARLAWTRQAPVEIIEMAVTNSYEEWQQKALELQQKADAFSLLNHNTLKDKQGRSIDQLEAGAWYLNNIKKPDLGHIKGSVIEGLLCAVDDSGFKQGYEAVMIAHRILTGKEDPANISVYAPEPGNFIVNMERARMLGLEQLFASSPLVDERIETAMALNNNR